MRGMVCRLFRPSRRFGVLPVLWGIGALTLPPAASGAEEDPVPPVSDAAAAVKPFILRKVIPAPALADGRRVTIQMGEPVP